MNITDTAQQLTLPLLTDKPPFMLAGSELGFGPDEWAWLFLRLNKDYVTAYTRISSNPVDENFATHLVDKTENLNVRPDVDGSCGRKFGLSAWLNPALKKLPALRDQGSWFFPLVRPASVSSCLPQSIEQPKFAEHPLQIKAPSSPILLSHESPFGFLALRAMPSLTARQMHAMRQRSWILIAIDCSRPIAGQMSALDRLAKIKRKYLMPHRDTHDHRKFLRPRILTECVLFSDEIYEHAGGLADQTSVIKELDEYSAKWRVIAFDALGPISIQNKKLLSLLADAHKSCVTFRQPIPGSFWRQLPNRNINGTASNGGNYLKALLCLAELNHLIGTIGDLPDSNRIMAAIPQQLSHRDPANAWRRDFAENIEEKYIRQANDLIDGGYKWLIHAQKPDPSVKRQASPVRTRPNPLHHNRGVRKGWEE